MLANNKTDAATSNPLDLSSCTTRLPRKTAMEGAAAVVHPSNAWSSSWCLWAWVMTQGNHMVHHMVLWSLPKWSLAS